MFLPSYPPHKRLLRTPMKLPIRIRLSVTYFAIFAAAGTLLCCAFYLMAERSLYTVLDHQLDEYTDDVRDFLIAHQLSADPESASKAVAEEFGVKDAGKWLQIKDDAGRWIYRSRHALSKPHDLPAASTLPASGSILEVGTGSKGIRFLRRPFTMSGRAFVIEIGISLSKTSNTLQLLRNELLLISPVIFIAAGLSGHIVSRRALMPVAAIAHEALRIHDGNLQTRLPRLETRDELAHLSTTLNEMLERIESGVHSVRDFTAYASHELRTPVAFIRSEADLALKFDLSGHEYREAIQAISSEAQSMSVLLDSLLFLTRIDAHTEHVDLQPSDARRMCLGAFEKWNSRFHEAGIQLNAELPAAPVVVMADPRYFQRLLDILLENALKYTKTGGSTWLLVETANGSAHFSIRDTGIGIPEDEIQNIFERFRRGSNAQDAKIPGSGLGLALAAWISERHQTALVVESSVAIGTSFSWVLPLDREMAHADYAEKETVAAAMPARK